MTTDRYGYLFSLIVHCALVAMVIFKSAARNAADLNTLYEVSLISQSTPHLETKSPAPAAKFIKKTTAAAHPAQDKVKELPQDESEQSLNVDLSAGLGELSGQLAGHGAANEIARTIKSLLNAVQSALIYPDSAKEREIEGKVLVEISIKNYEITKVNLYKSSGHSILDQAALAGVVSVKRTQNIFQQIKNEIVLIVPVKFNLLN